jgi:hypothetical protein
MMNALEQARVEIFLPTAQFHLGNFKIITMCCRPEFHERIAIMALSINNSTSGFRKWSEAQELQRRGETRAEAGEAAVILAPGVDQAVMPPAEQPHRPWLVPGAGKI